MSEKDSRMRQEVLTENANCRNDAETEPVEPRENKEQKKKEKPKPSELNIPSSSNSASKATLTEALFKETVNDLFCDDTDQQIRTLQYIKTILSKDENPPIDALIKDKVAPRCVEFLRHEQNTNLQLEAVTVLATITTGTGIQAKWVGRKENIEPLLVLIQSSDIRIVEQALWALGSILERIPILRNFLLTKDIVSTLVALLKSTNSSSMVRHVAMTLSILRFSNSSPPQLEEAIQLCLAAVDKILLTIDDLNILVNVVTALHNLTLRPEKNLIQFVESGIVPKLVQLLDSEYPSVVVPCITIVQNLSSSDDGILSVFDADVFPYLTRLLKSADPSIVTGASCVVTNIAVMTIDEEEEYVVDELVPLLIGVLKRTEFSCKRQAVRALALVAEKQIEAHMISLCKTGAIVAVCGMFKCGDKPTMWAATRVISEVTKYATRVGINNKIHRVIEQYNGWDGIAKLQSIPSPDADLEALSL